MAFRGRLRLVSLHNNIAHDNLSGRGCCCHLPRTDVETGTERLTGMRRAGGGLRTQAAGSLAVLLAHAQFCS